MTFQELLDELTEVARNNRDNGTQFERLIANYLLADPQYVDRLADVWLWGEWPDRWSGDVGTHCCKWWSRCRDLETPEGGRWWEDRSPVRLSLRIAGQHRCERRRYMCSHRHRH